MTITVKSCNTCPLLDFTPYVGFSCQGKEGKKIEMEEITPPQWCPLKKEPAIIALKSAVKEA